MNSDILIHELVDAILEEATSAERKAYAKLQQNNATFNHIGLFKLKRLATPTTIKLTATKLGDVTFRHYNKNKFKGFTVTTKLTKEEILQLYRIYVPDAGIA